MTDKDYQKQILALLSELSDERVNWLKDVAWNLARVTRKYDRNSLKKELSYEEYNLLMEFEIEEGYRYCEEIDRENERIRMELERKDSSSIKYLFPIGEA